ncbi:diguanylate cyclase [Mycolicibacterium thermoresistibile]
MVPASREGTAVMAWWRRPDHFHWFSGYLRDRGLLTQWRWAIFVFTVLFAALPLVMLGSPLGPDHTRTVVIAVAAAVVGFTASLVWLIRWPTRNQSLLYSLVACLCVAATCLVLSSAYAGLMGCTVFAVIGGFLAYFHSLSHVIANFGVAVVCAAVTATRLVTHSGDVALTVSAVLTVAALNVGVPFGVQSLVHSLRVDLRNSDRDPLTGLRNRRSFYSAVHELAMAQRGSGGVRLNVTMLDLDDFKRLNDTHGHAVGDQALVSVGDVLRKNCVPDAVLGRLGGEEFLIADADAAAGHARTVERIRVGIAAMPFEVTGSFGTCNAAVEHHTATAHPEFIDRMIETADAAMYQSKRAGGNRAAHVRLDQTT